MTRSQITVEVVCWFSFAVRGKVRGPHRVCAPVEKIFRPLVLTIAGGGLAAQPYFTDTQWEWNGLPTEYVGMLFLAVGLIWLAFAATALVRNPKSPETP